MSGVLIPFSIPVYPGVSHFSFRCSSRAGTWCATSCGCRTALATTARGRPALRLAVASGVALAAAIDAFLSQPDLAPTTRAKYRQTLAVLEDALHHATLRDVT